MRWLQKLRMKLRAVLWRSRLEREMAAELDEHLQCETEELIARGVPPAEASQKARATIGRLNAIKEECRDSRGTVAWEQLKQDVGFGLRLLLKNGTFSATALATIALGIGSTTAVFSLIDNVLVRPLPFHAAERLYYADNVGVRGSFDTLRANSRLADYAAHLGVSGFNVSGRDWPERLKGSRVSANFFQVLGANPLLGRTFAEGEDRPGKSRLVILSHNFWSRRYASRPNVLGKQLIIDEAPHEIVGVMPPEFHFPSPASDFWVPMTLDPQANGEYWGSGGIRAFGRLRPGVTTEVAASEFRAWIPRIREMFPWRMPDSWGQEAGLTPLQEHLVAGARVRSLLLFAGAVLVLLIAIVNVANLMIGQAAARQRELALRTSLGATPGRLARQLLTEAVVLAGAAGLLGVLLAFGQLSILKSLLPPDTPRLAEVAIDGRILAFSAALSLGSGLLFGLLPSWRMRMQRTLTIPDGPRATVTATGLRADAVLVMAEAAFATMLLVGAGLLLRSFWNTLQMDFGFRSESVVTAELSSDRAAAGSLEKTVVLFENVRAKLIEYPGVTSVAAANVLPVTPEISANSMAIEDHPRPPQEPQFVLWSTTLTPEYLDTLGIRLVQGRSFTPADSQGSEPVVLISRATALRFWPDANPVGRRLRPLWQDEWRTIVGVVDDVKNYGIVGPPHWVDGDVYVPLAQAMYPPRTLVLAMRLTGDSSSFEKRLPEMVEQVCAGCAVSKVTTMESVVADAVQAPRSMAWSVGGFALLALVLAAVGIYGVISHAVFRRTREMGVRLALGARRGHIAWLVLGSSLRSTVVGVGVGLCASWALTRWMKSLLYGIAETDPISFVLAPAVLVAGTVLATLIPISRAIRIDPAETLRET